MDRENSGKCPSCVVELLIPFLAVRLVLLRHVLLRWGCCQDSARGRQKDLVHCNASNEHASLSTPFSVPPGSYLHPHCEDTGKQIGSPPRVEPTFQSLFSSLPSHSWTAESQNPVGQLTFFDRRRHRCHDVLSVPALSLCCHPVLRHAKNLRAALDWLVLFRPPCFPRRLYIVPFLPSPNRSGKDSHYPRVLLASSPEWATHDTVPPRSRSEIRTTVKGTGKQL